MRWFLNPNWIATAALSVLFASWGPSGAAAHVYWTNENNGTIGRANGKGTVVNETFIPSVTGGAAGGAGMTVNNEFIYWTSANGGTAKHIRRAILDGTGVNQNFITATGGAGSLAIEGKHIYWPSNGGTAIGRATRDGTGVNQNFITGLNGEIAFLAIDSAHIYWRTWGNRFTLAPLSGGRTSTAPASTKPSSQARREDSASR